ncbi:MAG: hypothetical protein ACJAVR_001621 [Paracoccaceae bacterium]|jgi:hypothetical protein
MTDPRTHAPGIARVALALAIAGATLAAICALLAWGVYALNFDDGYGVSSRARFAALAMGGGLAVFSFTAAPLALMALRALGRRSRRAFALAGAAAGPVFVLAVTAMTGAPAAPAALIAFAVIGALHLIITHKAAGV